MPNYIICQQPRRTPDSFQSSSEGLLVRNNQFCLAKDIKTQKYFGSNSVESAYLRCIKVNAKTNMMFCSQLLSRGFKSRKILKLKSLKWKLSIYKTKPLLDTRSHQDLVIPNSQCILKIVGQKNWLAVQKNMKLDYYLTLYTKTNLDRINIEKEKENILKQSKGQQL